MSIGRPIQYDTEKVLDAAMQQFWANGYEATSLQILLESMCLSRSSLYHGFGGKKDLFMHCIERYCTKKIEVLAGSLNNADSGLAFIKMLLLNAASEASRGDMLMNIATEFAQKDSQIARKVLEGLNWQQIFLRLAVQRSQCEGDIFRDLDPNVLASYFVCLLGGINAVAQGGMKEQEISELVSLAMECLSK